MKAGKSAPRRVSGGNAGEASLRRRCPRAAALGPTRRLRFALLVIAAAEILAVSSAALFCVAAAAARPAASAPAHERGRDPFLGYGSIGSADSSFVIYYPERLEPMAREIGRDIMESMSAVAAELGLDRVSLIRVYLAPDNESFKYLHNWSLPEWGGAFSDLGSQVLGINTTLVLRDPRPLDIVVRHELSHLLLAQRLGGIRAPTWFMEGLAMRQAGEWDFQKSWELMSLAARRKVPSLLDLEGPFPRPRDEAALAYGVSYVAVDELFRERPDALATFTAFVRDRRDFESAFETTFGRSTAGFAAATAQAVGKRYKLPGTIVNAAPYWVSLALLFVAVYVAKRVRTRRKVEEWERREEERRAEEIGRAHV